MSTRIPVGDVTFREDLYPRIKKDPTTVQKYAEDLDVLPPIEVNQDKIIIDGWNRWTAHKKMEAETIAVTVTETESDAHLLELAIERNAAHGLQLSQEDKKDMVRRIYHSTPERERDAKKEHLAKILSVSPRTVRGWLSRIDKDAKEARNRRIFELWMQCWTQEEIAEAVGLTKVAVHEVCSETASLPKLNKPDQAAATHATDFKPPIYNIHGFQDSPHGCVGCGHDVPPIHDPRRKARHPEGAKHDDGGDKDVWWYSERKPAGDVVADPPTLLQR